MHLSPTNHQRRLLTKPLIQALMPLAERRGISPFELFRGTSVSEQKLKADNFRLTAQEMLTLLGSAEEKINDPHLWQLVAEVMFSNRLSPLIDLLLHAQTLKHALINLSQFQNLLQPFLFTPIRANNHVLHLDLIPTAGLPGKLNRSCHTANCKFGLALLLVMGRKRGLPIDQWQIYLPDDISPPPSWSKWVARIHLRSITSLNVPLSQLKEKSPDCKPSLYRQALGFCQIQHQSIDQKPVMLMIFQWLSHQIDLGKELSLQELSVKLGISLSSCKRLLASNGYSFQKVYDLIRLSKLLSLLQTHPYSNVELAHKLGYSNPNNFRRACKRWLGIVPEDLRRQQSTLFLSNAVPGDAR